MLAFMLRHRIRAEPLLIASFTASTILGLVLGVHHRSAGQFWPSTRGDGLIVGCLIAIVRFNGRPLVRMARWVAAVGVPPTVVWLVATPVLSYWRYIELPIAAVAFGALIVLAVDDPRIRALLAWRPLVRLGGISYSLYLWHYPLMEAFHAEHAFVGAASVFLIPVALLVAAASTRWIEAPFRRRRSARLERAVLLLRRT